jgi:hypothetical protein
MNAARFRRHTEGVLQQMSQNVDYLRERIDNFDEQLRERSKDEVTSRIQWNYAEQSVKEPVDERARMLEHAAAGVVDVRLTPAEHATVQRIVQELDPDDVLSLSFLALVSGNIFEGETYRSAEHLRWTVWTTTINRDALAASGCLRITYGGGGAGVGVEGQATVTRHGRLVLRVLRSYIAAHPPTTDAPGRPLIPGSRSELDARGFIGAHLWGEALRLPLPSYSYVKCGRSPKDLPASTGKATLSFFMVPPAKAQTLASVPGDDKVARAMPGNPVNGISVTVDDITGQTYKVLHMHGPHDVLRWLAEDVEADWI